MADDQCPICCAAYGTGGVDLVSCSSCKGHSCVGCLHRYIDTATQSRWSCTGVQCMHCESELSISFLNAEGDRLDATARHRFLKTVWANIQQSLFIKEQLLLANTEEVINLDAKIDHLVKLKLSFDTRLSRYIKRLKEQRVQLSNSETVTAGSNATNGSHARCAHGGCIGRLCSEGHDAKNKEPSRQSSNVLRCSVCFRRECGDCGAKLLTDASHTCVATDVDTNKAIATTTRRCPCCRVPIERASGCSQMFCTVCKVSFDWKTGNILHRNIHNPHFFEWRTAQTCAFDSLTHPIFTASHFSAPSVHVKKRLAVKVATIFSAVVYLGQMVDSPQGGRWCPPRHANNTDLRKKLLNKSITMDAFKRRIRDRSMSNFRKLEFRTVLDTARTVCIDYLAQIQHALTASDDTRATTGTIVCNTIQTVLQEIEAYREIANKALADVGVKYNVVSPQLDENWVVGVRKKEDKGVKELQSQMVGVKRKVLS